MKKPTPLHHTPPEAQGISSQAVIDFVNAVDQTIDELHGFVLMRHGAVIAQGWWAPYTADRGHMLFSLSKSFTSTAVGLAQAEGLLSVDDLVLSFFPEEAPANPDPNLAQMRIRHLLSMATGHDQDATGPMIETGKDHFVKGFLSLPVEHEPGSKFVYNSAATYMCSAIVQKVTGQTLLDYLGPRLFEPLEIHGATWESCPRGINMGGWGLMIKTEDIARFGQLYLQKGCWAGQQIIPEAWVEAATRMQISNGDPAQPSDWQQGYGYQFWRCQHGAYRGDGAFGQYCIVMPDQDAVLAINAGVSDMQAVLNLVWKHLLPAMQPAPLPENPARARALKQKLKKLSLPLPQGQPSSPIVARVDGEMYQFEANEAGVESVSLDFTEPLAQIIYVERGHMEQVTLGTHEWAMNTVMVEGHAAELAGIGVWKADDIYEVTTRFIETPFYLTRKLTFKDDELIIETRQNVSFGPLETKALHGKRI